jgi:PEP-CTERM motif
MKRLCLTATMFGLLAMASGRVDASSLTLSFSGEFTSTTTVGGTALGAVTPFTYTAVFDSTTGIPIGTGVDAFLTVATFNISGVGTFTSAAGDDLYVGLADPTSNTAHDYEAVLTNLAATADFGAAYKTATPAFTAAAPVPTTFSDFVAAGGKFPFTIALAGGAGDLVVTGLATGGPTPGASIALSSVPEPATLTLSGIGLVLVGLASWYRSRSRRITTG